MPHLSKPAVARLAVFLTATLLVLAGLQLATPSPDHAVQAEGTDRIDLAQAGTAARPSATPTHPLTLPGVTLQARAEAVGRSAARSRVLPEPQSLQKHEQKREQKPSKKATKKAMKKAAKKAARKAGAATSKHPPRKKPAKARRAAKTPHGGRDISWPQCPPHVGIRDLRGQGQPMPPRDIRFVIVGLTNGRAFTPNPCLAMHLRWVRSHHVWASAYAFTTYPTRQQVDRLKLRGPFNHRSYQGKLGNAGYAAARYNIRTMKRHDFATPHVWLDVEASSSRPWSHRHDWNRAVVDGWIRAYRDAGYTVGFYSTISIWQEILGNTRYRLPEWRTAGPDNAAAALGRCRQRSFQGGRAVLAQWWDSKRDYNLMCPGFGKVKTMRTYFHKY